MKAKEEDCNKEKGRHIDVENNAAEATEKG